MKRYIILGLVLMLLEITLISCDKEEVTTNQEKILGTWISLDKSDTLDFVDNSNFYHSSLTMRYDHYDYQLFADSIKLVYNGKMLILVVPTRHKYFFEGNQLIMDFSNKSTYGFNSEVMTYDKQ